MECDRCGKDMSNPTRTSSIWPKGGRSDDLVGSEITFQIAEDTSPEEMAYFQKQLGPYEIGRTYRICWQCLLEVHGIKP